MHHICFVYIYPLNGYRKRNSFIYIYIYIVLTRWWKPKPITPSTITLTYIYFASFLSCSFKYFWPFVFFLFLSLFYLFPQLLNFRKKSFSFRWTSISNKERNIESVVSVRFIHFSIYFIILSDFLNYNISPHTHTHTYICMYICMYNHIFFHKQKYIRCFHISF